MFPFQIEKALKEYGESGKNTSGNEDQSLHKLGSNTYWILIARGLYLTPILRDEIRIPWCILARLKVLSLLLCNLKQIIEYWFDYQLLVPILHLHLAQAQVCICKCGPVNSSETDVTTIRRTMYPQIFSLPYTLSF